MEIQLEILEYLFSPISWAMAEVLAIVLFFYCLLDILKTAEEEKRIIRVFELFGFVLYAGLFSMLVAMLADQDWEHTKLLTLESMFQGWFSNIHQH